MLHGILWSTLEWHVHHGKLQCNHSVPLYFFLFYFFAFSSLARRGFSKSGGSRRSNYKWSVFESNFFSANVISCVVVMLQQWIREKGNWFKKRKEINRLTQNYILHHHLLGFVNDNFLSIPKAILSTSCKRTIKIEIYKYCIFTPYFFFDNFLL